MHLDQATKPTVLFLIHPNHPFIQFTVPIDKILSVKNVRHGSQWFHILKK
jgi:hypothetical protein